MIRHHIQNSILYKLAFSESLRFSELKPEGIDNKLFDYHLKQLIRDKLVSKSENGNYNLSSEGKRLGAGIFNDQLNQAKEPRSVMFLVIRRKKDGAWLFYKRATHPLKDKVGFMHLTPKIDQRTTESASEEVEIKTGLKCSFKVLGGGLFRIFNNTETESFTNFTLLVCEDAEGQLMPKDERADYFWQLNPDFNSDEMLVNMAVLADLYSKGKTFYIEKTFSY